MASNIVSLESHIIFPRALLSLFLHPGANKKQLDRLGRLFQERLFPLLAVRNGKLLPMKLATTSELL